MSILYRPPPTVEAFMRDGESIVRVCVGPIGSGKSMGCIMELLRRARMQEPWNGVRYTRFAAIRNTNQQLRQTVLTDIKQYLGPMVSYYVTDSTVQIRAGLPDGTRIECDILLIPLDKQEDQQRLLSLQLTGAWINELREVPADIIGPLLGRLGRYPSKAMGGPTWHGLIADTNPWDTDSPYHEKLVLAPPKGWTLYHQPSGIGPDAENIENLPAGYYENLLNGRDEDWASVHVESNWGSSNAGQAVFRKSFDTKVHVKDITPVVNPMRPLMIGLDFGRTPCAVICQVDNFGRLIVFQEVVTEGMGLPKMLSEYLKPALMMEPFVGQSLFVVGDPAGRQKSQLSEETAFDVLRDYGFRAVPASTNNIESRLTTVEKSFTTHIAGQPGVQISRTGCPTLISALGNKYRFRRRKDGQLDDLPEKLHPWSDVVDAFQYACLGMGANLTGRVLRRSSNTAQAAPMPMAAWT